MTEKKFVWPADMPPMEISYPGTASDGRAAWIIKTIRHPSLDESRFHWLLSTERGWDGCWGHTQRTYKSGLDGLTSAYSGLRSRRGNIRIIREGVPAVEWEGMIAELKDLAAKVLHGRQAAVFERLVIHRLMDPFALKPPIADLAREFDCTPQRIRNIRYEAWKKIEAAKKAAEAKEEAATMTNKTAAFALKRATGGISYQHEGQFWDPNEMPRASNYSTSINSAATAPSTNDIKESSNG